MKYEIIELNELSGNKATIYSVIEEGQQLTLFDQFINEYIETHRDELRFIVDRLEVMGHITGAREQFFKIAEGKPGDGVCALYDEPKRMLRLYCIRYGSAAIILGGGGIKNVRAWQDDKKLLKEAEMVIQISKDVMERMKDKELKLSIDGKQLIGNLIFSDNEK